MLTTPQQSFNDPHGESLRITGVLEIKIVFTFVYSLK